MCPRKDEPKIFPLLNLVKQLTCTKLSSKTRDRETDSQMHDRLMNHNICLLNLFCKNEMPHPREQGTSIRQTLKTFIDETA